MMKYLKIIIFCALCSLNTFSQSEKETVYLLFDTPNNEICRVEDGSGNILKIRKFRKEKNRKGFIDFNICDEKFIFNLEKNKKDTCFVKSVGGIKNIKYLLKKYEESNEFKHHIFKKIFIVEKISIYKIVKYEVYWSGEWAIK